MPLLTNSFWAGLDLSAFTVPGALAPFSVWMNLALGILLCFFGARLFSASVLCFSGLLAGLGSYIWLAARIEPLPSLVIAIIAGILCALVLRSLLKIGFFMLGVVIGGSVAGSFLGDSIWVVAIMLASGIMSMLLYRLFIALISALCGALLLAGGLLAWIGPETLSNPYVFPTLAVLLFLAGLFFQSGRLRSDKTKEE